MSTTPITPYVPFGTTFPSSPIQQEGMGARQNSSTFSLAESVDNFDPAPNPSRVESPTIPNSEIIKLDKGICSNFFMPSDTNIPDRRIIAIFSSIAAENALDFEPGNVYHVFEHANMICNLENAVRTLAAGGAVNIKTAIVSEDKSIDIIPRLTTTVRNFNELIQWRNVEQMARDL
jgi:hypothetical protein